jgi:tRNA A-37 threonylcarbamoyl transferase component Bud32
MYTGTGVRLEYNRPWTQQRTVQLRSSLDRGLAAQSSKIKQVFPLDLRMRKMSTGDNDRKTPTKAQSHRDNEKSEMTENSARGKSVGKTPTLDKKSGNRKDLLLTPPSNRQGPSYRQNRMEVTKPFGRENNLIHNLVNQPLHEQKKTFEKPPLPTTIQRATPVAAAYQSYDRTAAVLSSTYVPLRGHTEAVRQYELNARQLYKENKKPTEPSAPKQFVPAYSQKPQPLTTLPAALPTPAAATTPSAAAATLMDPKERCLNNFDIGSIIGRGSSAVVRLGTFKPTGTQVAFKTYLTSKLTDPERRLGVEREATTLSKLNHKNIVQFFGRYSCPGQIHIVMEYPGSRSLYDYVRSFPERKMDANDARPVLKQLVEAMSYLHANGFAHRDLKLENILYSKEGCVKMIDFGFACCSKTRQRLNCGTPTYMSPELCLKKDYLGSAVDMWALGVLIYRVLTGYYPFNGKTTRELENRIADGKFDSKIIEDPTARDMVESLLIIDPDKRLSAFKVNLH